MVKCSVAGCDGVSDRRGWCCKHYARWYRTGDPLTPITINPDVPKTDTAGYKVFKGGEHKGKREHVVVAERALGKPLPKGAVVHHINGDRADNRPTNLVICQDNVHHNLIHTRTKAVLAGCSPDWRRCGFCKQHDDPKNMVHNRYGTNDVYHHTDCRNKHQQEYRSARRK